MSNKLGLYIHIPFCRSKCPYCDFFSKRANYNDYTDYAKSVRDKLIIWSEKTDKEIDTVYFGGGTPSVVGADIICDIINCIKEYFILSDNAEITMEANPASGRFFDFAKVYNSGVNRVSLGLQSANNNELKQLGRIHSADDVVSAVNLIRSSGINNISLDLMIGIPEQTTESLKYSIDFCSQLDVQHISSYMLKIEQGTVFDKKRDKYNFPDDDKTADLYLFSVDYLNEKGFEQYEISNFCKKGYESRHNLKYWKLEEYLGIGPSAHSFMDGRRFYYESSIEGFKNNNIIDDGIGGNIEEYIMLGLRLKEGIDITIPEAKLSGEILRKSEKLIKSGLMELNNGHLSFTKEGFLVSNSIIADFI
jgi:oxygen-independent coproporphyrinogen-3 oxidase